MPPNTVDPVIADIPYVDAKTNDVVPTRAVTQTQEKYGLKIFQSTSNLLAHILIGATVAINLLFAFRNGLPLNPTMLHIVLCVIGYQLLMAESILSLTAENGWTSNMRLVDKRRAHWILQILGSGLAIGGSFHMILDKTVNWNTLHGQFGLVAMVFTVVSMVNGLTSLYAYELRNIIPGNFSKLGHICFGIVAFGAASISLCYGYDKNMFRNWATVPLTNLSIAFVAIFTFIIIVNPSITFFNKSKAIFKK